MSGAKHIYPGITVKCESGRYIAFYEHRTDIIANGENEKDAKKNLKRMYKVVLEHETEIEAKKLSENLPKAEVKAFFDKF